MADTVRITEADLRTAMRDPRYLITANPERAPFGDWVSGGWRALYPRDGAARSSVWVRAYVREGHRVSAHFRGAPAGRSARTDGPAAGRFNQAEDIGPDRFQPAQFLRIIPRVPSGGRGGGGNRPSPPTAPRRLRIGPDGRDHAEELRRDPETQYDGVLQRDVEQWQRPTAPEQRQRDLQRLNPVGEPKIGDDGEETYQLPDGRIATLRKSTSSGKPLTLELAEPGSKPGRFNPTDKFRYGATE